ncbi:hypothetical protein ACOSP7_032036 [Xanthoceras sorbifolium]
MFVTMQGLLRNTLRSYANGDNNLCCTSTIVIITVDNTSDSTAVCIIVNISALHDLSKGAHRSLLYINNTHIQPTNGLAEVSKSFYQKPRVQTPQAALAFHQTPEEHLLKPDN